MALIPFLVLQAACLLAGNAISVTLRTCYIRYIRGRGADGTRFKSAIGDFTKADR